MRLGTEDIHAVLDNHKLHFIELNDCVRQAKFKLDGIGSNPCLVQMNHRQVVVLSKYTNRKKTAWKALKFTRPESGDPKLEALPNMLENRTNFSACAHLGQYVYVSGSKEVS